MAETTRHPPRLLVSIRNTRECLSALQGKADIIDIKEPQHGALGMADPPVIQSIVELLTNFPVTPLSVALGELPEWRDRKIPAGVVRCANWCKLGLAGAAQIPHWREIWSELVNQLSDFAEATRWIAVIYADWDQAKSPPPLEILEIAEHLGCAGVLIDTWNKSAGRLTDYPLPQFDALLKRYRNGNAFQLALAGSLRESDLPSIAAVQPDIIGIRGAACRNGLRESELDSSAVSQFREAIQRTEWSLKHHQV